MQSRKFFIRMPRSCLLCKKPGELMTRYIATMVLSLLSFSLALCASGRAAEPIRIAYSSVNPHALLSWMAEKRGLYSKYGLSSMLVYVPGGSVAIQALVRATSIWLS